MNYKIIPSTKTAREKVRLTQRSKHSSEKICIYCNEKFDYGYSSLKSCLACKIIVQCSICGKEFELNLKLYSGSDQVKINKSILNKEDLELFCSQECRTKHSSELLKKFHKNYPGFNIRFGEVYYYTKNILTGEITRLNNFNFITKDNILYFLDKRINDYVPWEDYKEKFKNFNENNDFINELNKKFNGEMIKTFITKEDSKTIGHAAFERLLVDKNIEWFVYIKFYIDKNNNIKPLVVGKSCSYLVNNSGSDLNFSLNENDGVSRKFLIEENLDWLYEYVYIINVHKELDAFILEELIYNTYNVFYS